MTGTMMMTSLAVVVLALACFLSFGYGIRFYFDRPRKTLPMYLVADVGTAIAFVHLGLLAYRGVWQGQLGGWRLVGALTLYAASLAIYWWTLLTVKRHRLTFAYTRDVPTVLIEAGPYRAVRHPFYTAYTLCFLGAPLALGSWWLLLTAVFMFLVYRQSAVMEERKFEASELAAEYRRYASRTGRFAPRPFPR